jgi:hypothetical protein
VKDTKTRTEQKLKGELTVKTLKKLGIVTGLVMAAGLAGVVAGRADNRSASSTVNLSVAEHISLKVIQGDSIDFGTIVPGSGPFIKESATTLELKTNDKTKWALTVGKKVPQGDGRAAEVLVVTPSATTGVGEAKIQVNYELLDNETLSRLPAGNYRIVVTFTAATK